MLPWQLAELFFLLIYNTTLYNNVNTEQEVNLILFVNIFISSHAYFISIK